MGSPPSGFAGLTSRFDLTKPLIAAVNGVAMGGGFEIALACDIILASENAVFALPEPRVGPGRPGRRPAPAARAIGTKRAMGMILTARRVSAAEGKELGFVHEVHAPQDLLRAAHELAKQICELGPMSIRASKQAVYQGLDEPSLEAALKGQNRYPAVAALYTSEDFKEGPLAFAQKRAPNWQGR
jgi:crotonobetainyl-CoA hydratase